MPYTWILWAIKRPVFHGKYPPGVFSMSAGGKFRGRIGGASRGTSDLADSWHGMEGWGWSSGRVGLGPEPSSLLNFSDSWVAGSPYKWPKK